MRRTLSSPTHPCPQKLSRSVAAVAVLRIIVIVVRCVPIVGAIVALGPVDVDVADESAIIGLALPGQVDLTLSAVAVAAIAAAAGDAADGQAAIGALLDPAD